MTTAAAAQLAITQELTDVLNGLVQIEIEMVKLKEGYDELSARREELLSSLQNDAGAPKAPRRRKTAGKDEADATSEAPAEVKPLAESDQSSTDLPETSPTVEPESNKEAVTTTTPGAANDDLDRKNLGELSDLADRLGLQDTGKMTADMLRAAIRAHHKVEDPLEGAKNFDDAMAGKPVKSSPKKAAPDPAQPITAAEQAEYEKIDDLYSAGVEPATDGQKRMIFAMLGSTHNIVSDVDKKAVIVGIIKEHHNGWVLESTKDLSKVWATDVIDYLKKHSSADLKKFYANAEPFK
jgi:hypothetical protein